jgi:hypothetical protein
VDSGAKQLSQECRGTGFAGPLAQSGRGESSGPTFGVGKGVGVEIVR